MDARFLPQNIHQKDPLNFQKLDAYLCKLKQFKYAPLPRLLGQFPFDVPGIYTLSGGNLTGKTTLLKLWMAQLLADGVPAQAITFLSMALINNDEDLIHLIQTQLKNKPINVTQYILIDDVTYLRNWDKAIKYATKQGLLDHTILMLSDSDKTISKKLQLHFPDRQTGEKKIDFQLYPLTFHETVALKHAHKQVTEIDLFKEFNNYLLHGGFLVAINDMETHGHILDETLKTYSDALQKTMLRHGKHEDFLHEILVAIIQHYCRPVTWNMLTSELSIDHPKTIGDYVTLLESLDVVFIQSVLLEEELKGAPKKARKLMFTDPFIFHAINAWLDRPKNNTFETQIKSSLANSELYSTLVTACAITHYRRYYPTYYIKAEGEISLACVDEQRFMPIIITWTNRLRPKDLQQALTYPNSKILTKSLRSGIIEHIRTEPLPQALWKLGVRHNE